MSDELEAAEKNWKNGDTRSSEYLVIQEAKRLDREVRELRVAYEDHLKAEHPKPEPEPDQSPQTEPAAE